jgi:SAM-dependent methyltransferase
MRPIGARLVTHGHHKTYKTLPSVWDGDDSDLLNLLLDFYPRTPPKSILDATVNRGRFWRGGLRSITGMDIDFRHRPTIVGDNMNMPFRGEIFDVVVYDPPHVPNQGKDRQKDFVKRFGLGMKSSTENGCNFSHLYKSFAKEAHRVLKPDGILFCKITDYIHNHRYQWAHIEMVEFASLAGLVPCDCIVKIRKGPIVDPKWKIAHHARHQHCYWLVFRKSAKCE